MMSEMKMREALESLLDASLKYKLEESDMCVQDAREALAQTDAAPCVQKTAELTDEQIYGIFTEYGYERDLEDTSDEDFSVIRAVIAADRKLRGDA